MKQQNLRARRALAAVAALLLVGLAALPSGAFAQSSGASLTGRVVDDSGATLPGATVTVTNTATGLTRVATTAEDGAFRLPTLPVGDYDVKVELSGFGTVLFEDVQLSVATERELDVTMKLATIEEAITVVDEAPLVATSPSIGTIVSQEELETLPLNGRQFANLAILAPGTSLAFNSDPTKPGQLTVALNGGIGRNVNYIMDGGDNTDDTIGGALQNFNLEAVAEFKIQTQQYKAEFGRSTGGVLSVVTKTGTNEFSGSVYGFFRDDSLAEKTHTEELAGIDKQPYERQQYGASLGGPIVRDRAHFFATYERTDRETSYTINTDGAFPNFDGISVPTPFEDELLTAKATWDLSASQFLQVRYGFQENADKYGASPIAAPSNLGTVANEYSSILAGHTAQFGSDKLNEFVFQYTSFDNSISADSNDPLVTFPSGFATGQNGNTPQTTSQRKYQYRDDFSFSTTIADRRHDWKVGVNYIDEPTLGGDFSTGLAGQFVAIEDRPGAPISDIFINGGFFGDATPVEQYSAYAQDDWAVSDRLTVNVGLRYDYWAGFDLDQRSNPIWQALSTQNRFNEGYLRDFQGGGGGVLENDDDNFGPRLGFTWDMSGDGRRLLRGGWGIYYDFPYTNATILFPAAAVQSNFGVVFAHTNPNGIRNPDGSFFQPGDPLPANQLQNPDLVPPNEVASPTLATPYSNQLSLGYSWQVNNWLGLNVEAVTIEYRDIPFRFRANPFVDANGNDRVDPGETRRFPQFGNFRIWHGGGEADYQGVNLGARVRRDKFELQGFYTYSEAEGNILAGADEFRLTDGGHQADIGGAGRADVSVDPLNPWCGRCFGPLNTDARHRLTFGGMYRAPWAVTISGMFRYRSSLPYTRHANADLNGDGFILDLPPGVSVNSERGDSFSQLDLRVAKEFTFGGDYGLEILAEVFNVLNEENPARFNRFGEPAAFAGDPLQGEHRLAQLGLRFRF